MPQARTTTCSQFTVEHRAGQATVLTAEASTLGFAPGETPSTVLMTSSRTGRTVRFDRRFAIRDGEGDVQYWSLVPTEADVAVEVRIFND